MEFMNEDDFKDLDTFIEQCQPIGAAIGDLNAVEAAIDASNLIPIETSTKFVGVLDIYGERTAKDYEDMIAMGVVLSNREQTHYDNLKKSVDSTEQYNGLSQLRKE